MTPEERKEFDDLKESVAKIHAALPALFAFRDNFPLWAKETGVIDMIVQEVLRLAVLPAKPSTSSSVPAPASTRPTMPPLSASQIATLGMTLTRAVAAGFITAGIRDSVKSELAAGIWPQPATKEVIDAVKFWRYEAPRQGITIPPDEDAALDSYLHIIDQRQKPEKPNDTLLPGDDRWVYVSTSAPITNSPAVSSSLVDDLRALGIYPRGGKIGFGGEPVLDTDAPITIHGGQILGKNKGNWQNPGAVLENVIDICNSDAGGRFLQNVRWFQGVMIVPAPTRPKDPDDLSQGMEPNPISISAFADSHNEECWSVDPVTDEQKAAVQMKGDRLYGQLFYRRVDWKRKKIVLCAFQPGWTIEIAGSSSYGDGAVKQL